MQGFFKGLLICATAACALSVAAPAYAEKDVKAALSAKKAEQAATEKKAKEIGAEIDGLKTKLLETSKGLRLTEESLSSSEARLATLKERKKAYLENIYKDEKAIGGIVSAARRYHSLSTPQLLAQSTPLDAARAALVMKSMLPGLQGRSAYFRGQLDKIAKVEDDITKELSAKAEELSKFNAKKKELASLLEERGTLYKQTEAARKKQEEEVKKLARDAKNIGDLVAKVRTQARAAEPSLPKAASNYKLPSSITLPVHGKVATGFGETDALGAKSKGVTFRARQDAAVVTPLAGTVRFAGPFQKYRQILIIEHGGGYHSLIAGLGRIDTVVGAKLDAGEPVGAAEASSESDIYYELRHNGDPVNPQKLTVAQKRQEKT